VAAFNKFAYHSDDLADYQLLDDLRALIDQIITKAAAVFENAAKEAEDVMSAERRIISASLSTGRKIASEISDDSEPGKMCDIFIFLSK